MNQFLAAFPLCLICSSTLLAQGYPRLSSEAFAAATARQKAADSRSDQIFDTAKPTIERWALRDKPYIPWAAEPKDLPQAGIPAFPGAQGGGKYSFGGRGGSVFVVTNLNDDGPGSFREACESAGPRIVLFNVAGIIELDDRIRIRASKTGKPVVIPLHPIVSAVLAKYGGQMPPAISNQRLNDYVKEAAEMVPSLQVSVVAGITKGGVRREVKYAKWELVSSHTARRSFASNLYRRGIPARTIMSVTGHRTDKAFMRYIRLDGEQHADMIAASGLFTLPILKAI